MRILQTYSKKVGCWLFMVCVCISHQSYLHVARLPIGAAVVFCFFFQFPAYCIWKCPEWCSAKPIFLHHFQKCDKLAFKCLSVLQSIFYSKLSWCKLMMADMMMMMMHVWCLFYSFQAFMSSTHKVMLIGVVGAENSCFILMTFSVWKWTIAFVILM